MKIFGAINDGYRFIYTDNSEHLEDWLYIYQNHFCILKIFELEVPDNLFIRKHNEFFINLCFDKRNISQEDYRDMEMKLEVDNRDLNVGVIFKNGFGMIEDNFELFLNKKYKIDLTKEEQIILQASRQSRLNVNKKEI